MRQYTVKHYRQVLKDGTSLQFEIGECQVSARGPKRALAAASAILAPLDDGSEYLVVSASLPKDSRRESAKSARSTQLKIVGSNDRVGGEERLTG